MTRTVAVGALLAALLVASARAQPAPALSFGRSGGNIRPYTVTISATGRVTAVGVKVGKTVVPAATLKALLRLAASTRLSSMSPLTLCPQTLPDFAGSWIRFGTHRVAVRGSCNPAFGRLSAALARAVALGA